MKANLSTIGRFRLHIAGTCIAASLVGCAAGNTGAKFRVDHVALPTLNTAPAAPIVLPPVCTANMTADMLPEPKPQGGFPAPETVDASTQVQAYLQWLNSYAHWARTGWARALDAKTYCDGVK